ncbi:S-layer homology domain-containing protein [Rossellomorea sp. YZS02]|uniref:S-layer homology domain-containing protein n=1 Tax=Rossellomorea sp. YZS02 TaxID=3097358 RepID=UPI002A0E451D|nr:S-layer homology domain-containing protein [Rossellomorea sp. YZS02]MDX8343182.1 S-layer homology domain-containing protein [Rossellomorea sp. YZS02]
MAYKSKSYRKFVAAGTTAALVASAIAPAASAAEHPFTDVNKNYEEAVSFLYMNDITKGYTETTFGTYMSLDRGNAAVIIANALGLDTENAPDAGFKDVNNRVKGSVNALVEAGIMDGFNDTEFRPNVELSRGAMAKILVNAYDLQDEAVDTPFTDLTATFGSYIEALYGAGITSGKTETTFGTNTEILRGEFAVLLYRTMNVDPVPALEVTSVSAIDDMTLSVTLSDESTHEVTLDEALVANEETEVTFMIDDVEYTATVTFEVEAPELMVSGVTDGAITKEAMHTLTVEATEGSDVTVMVGETEVEASEDGTYAIELAEGENTITVTASVYGVETTVTKMVTLDTVAPELSVSEVAEVVNTAELALEVSAEEGSTVVTTLNGEEADASALTLVEGENTIVVTATDAAGNVSTKELMVTLDMTAPVVESGEVADYQNLVLNLSEGVTGTPVVTVNGKEVETTLSEDGTQVWINKEAGYTAGTYNVVLSGLKDAAGNELVETTVSVVKEASVIADFDFTTSGVTNSTNQKVYFKLIDQYGENVTSKYTELDDNLTVTGVMGSFPLNVSLDGSEPFVTIADNLTANSMVSLTLTNKDSKGTVLGTQTASYVVQKDVVAAPTTISAISVANATQTAGTQNITLTADIRDQFNNPIDLGAGQKLRWTTSDETIVSLDGSKVTSKSSDGAAQAKTITVDMLAEGTADINVFLPNGTKVSTPLTLTVNQGVLDSIDASSASVSVENKAALTKANVKINPSEEKDSYVKFTNELGNVIGVKASDVGLVVKDSEGKEVTGEVTIEKVTDTNGNLTGLKVLTSRDSQAESAVANNPSKMYSVELTVGEKTSKFNVTSTINSSVSDIEVGKIADNSLTAGSSTVTQKVTFKNKHGEVIDVPAASVKVTASGGLTGVVSDNKDGIADTITFDASSATAGAKSVLVTVNGSEASLNYSVNVVKASELTKATFGTATDTLIANDPSVFVPVTFADQYSNKFDVAASTISAEDIVIEPKSSEQSASDLTVSLAKTVDKKLVTGATGTDLVTGFEVNADTAAKGTYTVKLMDGEDLLGSFEITVNAARTLNNVTVNKTSAKVALGGTNEIMITPVDQYGKLKAITPTVVASTEGVVSGETNVTEVKDSKDNLIGYKVTLTGEAKGTTDLTVSVVEGDVTKTAKVNVTVDSIGSLVSSVNINEKNIKSLHHTSETVDLSATSFDSTGKEVSVDPSNYVWTVQSVTKSDGTAGNVSDVSVDANGDVTFTAGYAGTAVIKVQSPNLKSDTVEIKFSNAAKSAQMGTTAVKDVEGIELDANTEVAGIQVALDGKGAKDGEEFGSVSFEIDALDQYGEIFEINESNAIVTTDDSSVLTVNKVDGAITVNAKSKGTAKVFVQYNGDTLEFDFTVTQEALDAAASLTEATDAVKKAETSKTQADVDAAKGLVDALPDSQAKTDLQTRIDAITPV